MTRRFTAKAYLAGRITIEAESMEEARRKAQAVRKEVMHLAVSHLVTDTPGITYGLEIVVDEIGGLVEDKD